MEHSMATPKRRIHRKAPLFLPDPDLLPDLRRLGFAWESLPEDVIVDELERRRGHGRDAFPVRAMWRATVAMVVLQHESAASFPRELERNPHLLGMCGFDPLGWQSPPVVRLVRGADGRMRREGRPSPRRNGAPTPSAFSRFQSSLVALERECGAVSGLVDALRKDLMDALPDYGKRLGADGKIIESHSTGRKLKGKGRPSDPDADWGRHSHRGMDRRAKREWARTRKWFGHKLHLVADATFELPASFSVERASASERKVLPRDLKALFAAEPELAGRCREFSADKGCDQAELKEWLWERRRIRPIIDVREMWRDEWAGIRPEKDGPMLRPLNDDWTDNVFHTEKGEVFCQCPVTRTARPMAFQGLETERDALKHGCPAAAYGLECEGRALCHRRAGVPGAGFGRTLRIHLKDADRRIFTPTPHGSPTWRRAYARRAALERINARLDDGFRFERHTIRGKDKMTMRVGLALAVMMALALGSIRAEAHDRMRSLVRPPPARAA